MLPKIEVYLLAGDNWQDVLVGNEPTLLACFHKRSHSHSYTLMPGPDTVLNTRTTLAWSFLGRVRSIDALSSRSFLSAGCLLGGCWKN